MKNRKIKLTEALFLSVLLLTGCGKQASNTISESSSIDGRDTLGFKYIDIVHSTHTDYGYTDHPIIALDLHKRFIDIALDMALQTKNEKPENRFVWTVEALDPFYLWWKDAPESRREEMLSMIKNKQIGITGMPFHVHPFIEKEQWKEMFDWIPQDVHSKLDIEAAIQHDVNGFPRAAAMGMLDQGVKYFWMGINPHWGGAPFKLPTAFWWKMPDDRKAFVWSGYPYWQGFLFFADQQWRIQQREMSSTESSWPRNGDLLLTDEASMRKAHEVCIGRLKDLREKGYTYPCLSIAFTNEWRCDNDGPMPQLLPFIKKWNEMGLKPALRMTTTAQAMKNLEAEVGDKVETLEGEWQDWWSFGMAANPRELQAARHASRYIKAITAPFWGALTNGSVAEVKDINRMLCRYSEHTSASNETSEFPYSLYNLGQMNEKAGFAFRSLERSKYLLAQQVRHKFTDMDSGLYVVNTSALPYTGWIKLDAVGFRGVNYQSVRDAETNTAYPLFKEGEKVWKWVVDENMNTERVAISEGTGAWFWVKNMPANAYVRYILQTEKAEGEKVEKNLPVLTFDKDNWITSAQWEGMAEPLFTEGLADFMVLNVKDNDRWSQGDIYMHLDDEKRIKKMNEIAVTDWGKPIKKAVVRETPYSWIITQEMSHPRVKYLNRQVEIFKEIPRARVKISFDRISSMAPEVFYAKFPFPNDCKDMLTTNGGIPMVPYKDQIPNSCKDFFVVDNWVRYNAQDGTRIWSSQDVPLVNFGGHNFGMRRQNAPDNSNELYGMLYNNVWVVNFCVDSPGEMHFEFDISFDKGKPSVEAINQQVDSYYVPMPIMNNPAAREDPIVAKYLNTPQRIKN